MKPPTFNEVAKQMRIIAYNQLGESSYWAVEQGHAIVPHLARLLAQSAEDKKKALVAGEPLVSYPFNIVWALAQIGGGQARTALAQQAAHTPDAEDRRMAKLALAGLDLRAKIRKPDVGVLRYASAPLLVKTSHESQKICVLKAGQGLRILKRGIENDKEIGARGGSTRFCEVQLLPGGQKGYLELEGEGFPLWF